MKKFFIALMLCMISTIAYCEIISLTHGWSKYYDQAFMNNEIEGRYSVKIDDKTQFGFYIDITEEGDTLCTLKMENWEEKGQKKIYYFFEDKAYEDNTDKWYYHTDDEIYTIVDAFEIQLMEILDKYKISYMDEPEYRDEFEKKKNKKNNQDTDPYQKKKK